MKSRGKLSHSHCVGEEEKRREEEKGKKRKRTRKLGAGGVEGGKEESGPSFRDLERTSGPRGTNSIITINSDELNYSVSIHWINYTDPFHIE